MPDYPEEALGRDSLFKQKLHQLRASWTSGQSKGTARATGELQSLNYLQEAHESLQQKDGDELTRLALLDSLTGLYNQKTITRLLTEELKRASRYKRPVALIVARVDNMEEVTAAGGMLISDTLVRSFADMLLDTVRDVDAPSRLSADSFMVFCPETNRGGAEIILNRIKQRLSGGFQVDIDRRWNLTISLGIASFPRDGSTADELISAAVSSLRVGNQPY
ncbi:MAG: GGDEF domain-containing protein [Cyanobacteria bacterium]|nr:GGDEF domain-containing protein [Cyanobacteriota bacterium]